MASGDKQDASKAELKIWDYTDYRAYLKDWYGKVKAKGKMSFRLFSRQCGFSSPNFLKLIMEGKRNLSPDGARKFAKGLGFNRNETAFFLSLVDFTQSGDAAEKGRHEKRMGSARRLGRVKPIVLEQYSMYSSWLLPVIYELAKGRPVDGLVLFLLDRIRPKVLSSQIEQGLRILKKLRFLSSSPEGLLLSTEPLVTTGIDAESMVVHDFHAQHLKLAAARLDEVSEEERDYSSLTIGIAQRRIGELKKKVHEFRQEVIRQFASDNPAEEVMILNCQLFPVTGKTK